jgi:hypothetical protein
MNHGRRSAASAFFNSLLELRACNERNHCLDRTFFQQRLERLLLEGFVIYRIAAAVIAGSLIASASVAQTSGASSKKEETSCTTASAATSGSGEEKTSNSMTVGKSAVLPDAGGANSAAPTVQSGDKPMVARKECPPDSKPK